MSSNTVSTRSGGASTRSARSARSSPSAAGNTGAVLSAESLYDLIQQLPDSSPIFPNPRGVLLSFSDEATSAERADARASIVAAEFASITTPFRSAETLQVYADTSANFTEMFSNFCGSSGAISGDRALAIFGRTVVPAIITVADVPGLPEPVFLSVHAPTTPRRGAPFTAPAGFLNDAIWGGRSSTAVTPWLVGSMLQGVRSPTFPADSPRSPCRYAQGCVFSTGTTVSGKSIFDPIVVPAISSGIAVHDPADPDGQGLGDLRRLWFTSSERDGSPQDPAGWIPPAGDGAADDPPTTPVLVSLHGFLPVPHPLFLPAGIICPVSAGIGGIQHFVERYLGHSLSLIHI